MAIITKPLTFDTYPFHSYSGDTNTSCQVHFDPDNLKLLLNPVVLFSFTHLLKTYLIPQWPNYDSSHKMLHVIKKNPNHML